MMEEGATGKEATTRRESQIRLDCIGSTSIIQREWGKQKKRLRHSFQVNFIPTNVRSIG